MCCLQKGSVSESQSQHQQTALLRFLFIPWQRSRQHGLPRALPRRRFFSATERCYRNKEPKPVRTHIKLATEVSHSCEVCLLCLARSQHLVQTTWPRQPNGIWLSHHQSIITWRQALIQLDKGSLHYGNMATVTRCEIKRPSSSS